MSLPIPKPRKPKVGILMYGNKTVDENKPFRKLAHLQKELIKQGYDKKLFHKHYYYGKSN